MPERRAAALLASAAFGLAASGAANAQELAGHVHRPGGPPQLPPLRVEVLDGRRFRDVETGTVYRLHGIDTCAPGQTARLGRQTWPCGVTATAWLVNATLNRWLSCAVVRNEGAETLARCASAAHHDVAAAMVRDGVAVSLPGSEQDAVVRVYAAAERDARRAHRGLWASTFQMPWDYRGGRAGGGVADLAREAAP